MIVLRWFSKLWQTFSTKSHFTSLTYSSAKIWLPRVTTFSSRTQKQYHSQNAVTLQFMLNWWTMDLEKYCATQLLALTQTLLSFLSTLRTERNYGKISHTFWRPAKRTKCSDIRFQGSSVMESTKRWVWSIQSRKRRNKLLICFTNQNRTIKTLRLMKNLMIHLSWQPVSMFQRKTCNNNSLSTLTTKKSKLHNWRC